MHNLRKIKLILSIICMSLGLLATFQSCANATTIDEIKADLKVLGENGVVGHDIYQTISLDGDYNNYSNYIIMITQGTHGNIPNQYFQPSKLATIRALYIISFNNNIVTNQTNDTRNDLYWFWNFGNKYGCRFNLNSGVREFVGSFALGDSIEPFYLYTTAEINTRLIHLGAGEEYGGSYLSKQIDFSPTYTDIVNYGDYNNVYAQKVRQNIIYLGTLNTDTNTYKYFRFKLFDTYSEEIGWLDYNVDNDYYSSNVLSAFLPPLKVYIERRLIFLNEVYTLVIYASDEPLNNDNTNSSDSIVLTYVFLRENATISGGTITNTGSGDDYNNQDSTNDIINNINVSTDDIINAITNTNIDSGDEPTLEDLPVIEIEDNTADFFTWVLTEFVRVLNSTENVSIDIPIYNTHNLVPSNFWVLDLEPLKTFIQAGWWFVVGVPFLKYMRTIIMHIRGGEIPVSDDKSDLLGNIL